MLLSIKRNSVRRLLARPEEVELSAMEVLGYTDYRNFEAVIDKARTACFNSGQRVEDHFVDITEMIEIGKGGQRPVRTVMMSRYACYLVIQNADPAKEIVAVGNLLCGPNPAAGALGRRT